MIYIHLPAKNDSRSELLEKAILAAKGNLGVDFEVYPIDTSTEDMLKKSDVVERMAAELYAGGYRRNETNVFFVRKGLRSETTNFCFGGTMGKTIIISDDAIWNSNYIDAMKVAMMAYLIEHELGHAYEAADDLHGEGIYDKHCLDEKCVMQQVVSVSELAQFARKNFLVRKKPGCFCNHCKKRFKRNYLSA